MLEEQKRYKAAGYAIFAVAIGLLICRILAYFIYQGLASSSMSEVAQEFALDTIFTLLSQTIFCFLIPFLIYKNYQKIPARQIFVDSHYKKPAKWWIIALCPLIALAEYFFSVLLNVIFLSIMMLFGYQPGGGASVLPQSFNLGLLLVSLFLTAVLPALCEEFAIRGIFLKTMRHTFDYKAVIIVMAISFGLFHQSIMQLFFTAIFGGFMAYLVIKTDSIWPAVTIHFCSNAISVFLDYADFYKWGNGFVDKLYNGLTGNGSLGYVGMIMILFLGAVVILTLPIVRYSKKNKIEKPVAKLYKPSVRESAFYIGAIVAASLTTIVTFMFGY